MNKSKNVGIDERKIKCCCDDDNCIESGISFDCNILNFHFLQECSFTFNKKEYHQTTRSMILNKDSVKELIEELKKISLLKNKNKKQ